MSKPIRHGVDYRGFRQPRRFPRVGQLLRSAKVNVELPVVDNGRELVLGACATGACAAGACAAGSCAAGAGACAGAAVSMLLL